MEKQDLLVLMVKKDPKAQLVHLVLQEKGENPVIQVRVELLEDPGIKVTLVQMEKLEPLVIQEEKENMVRQDPMVCM